MKLIAMLFVGLMVLACGLNDCLAMSVTHTYDNRSYEFELTSEKFYRAPKWNPQKSKHPPYPANKALEKGEEFIKRFPPKKDTHWEFQTLTLMPVKDYSAESNSARKITGWVWLVSYQLRPVGNVGTTGYWPSMGCFILMDGSVVEPKVSPSLPIFRN